MFPGLSVSDCCPIWPLLQQSRSRSPAAIRESGSHARAQTRDVDECGCFYGSCWSSAHRFFFRALLRFVFFVLSPFCAGISRPPVVCDAEGSGNSVLVSAKATDCFI